MYAEQVEAKEGMRKALSEKRLKVNTRFHLKYMGKTVSLANASDCLARDDDSSGEAVF